MTKELSFVEQLCYNTTRIETINSKGEKHVATGFFVSIPIEEEGERNRYISVLVTNRHVTEDAKQLTIWLNEKDKNGDPVDKSMVKISISDADKRFIMHPNAKIDLSIFPISSTIKTISQTLKKDIFYKTFPISFFMTDEKSEKLDAVEEVLMIGYPSGLWDRENNRPIFRYGITATDPKVDYEGRREFIIDCACIQGSSGSPVLLYNRGVSSNKYGKETKYDVIIASLLGVQYSIPIRNTEGEMIRVDTPTAEDKKPVIGLPINLGYIIKIQCLLDFIPILEKMAL